MNEPLRPVGSAIVADPARREALRAILIEPVLGERSWSYGAPDERFQYWAVAEVPEREIELAYCEQGFGPEFPWGFLYFRDPSLGMDAQWNWYLEEAFMRANLWPGLMSEDEPLHLSPEERFPVRVRPASPADAESIASLLRAAFAEFEALYTPQGYQATTPAGDEIRNRFAEGPIWIAEQQEAIAGTVSAVLKDEGLYIRSMAVYPWTRGRGVATLLLDAVEQFARGRSCSRLFLSTTPFLASAIRLYERAGFRRTDEEPHDLFGTPLVTMVKELASAETE
ncbi:MAG TPA: GNAT family N-acetyltransferase [Thermoanaerobaculia bacterium]|jgi:ribosomal protein S18 acetylase RimI-like enzyme|nr:GNAT family N-acetyltransferase [Thermoanaerobaculia bacterium]